MRRYKKIWHFPAVSLIWKWFWRVRMSRRGESERMGNNTSCCSPLFPLFGYHIDAWFFATIRLLFQIAVWSPDHTQFYGALSSTFNIGSSWCLVQYCFSCKPWTTVCRLFWQRLSSVCSHKEFSNFEPFFKLYFSNFFIFLNIF